MDILVRFKDWVAGKRAAYSLLRVLYWLAVLFLLVVKALGELKDAKFVSIKPLSSFPCYAHTSEINHIACCTREEEEGHSMFTGPCYSKGFLYNLLVSPAAFVLPLLPACFFALSFLSERYRRRKAFSFLLLPISLIVYRTFFLYVFLNSLESTLFAPTSHGCWYQHLSRSGACSAFDASDHLVLYIVQYHFVLNVTFKAVFSIESNGLLPAHRVLSKILRFLAFLTGSILALAVFYHLVNTILYFHTFWEDCVAVLISFLSVEPFLPFLEKHYIGYLLKGKEKKRDGESEEESDEDCSML